MDAARRGLRRLGYRLGATALRTVERLTLETAIVPGQPSAVDCVEGTVETRHRRTPVEVYVPDGATDRDEAGDALPHYLNFHGGEFVFGRAAMDAAACRWLADTVDSMADKVGEYKDRNIEVDIIWAGPLEIRFN